MNVNEKTCSGCPEQNRCSEVYKKLGSMNGSSVLAGVFAAFVLPMSVFILSAVFFWSVLSGFVKSKNILTVLVLLAASFLAFISILFVKMVSGKLAKRKE